MSYQKNSSAYNTEIRESFQNNETTEREEKIKRLENEIAALKEEKRVEQQIENDPQMKLQMQNTSLKQQLIKLQKENKQLEQHLKDMQKSLDLIAKSAEARSENLKMIINK